MSKRSETGRPTEYVSPREAAAFLGVQPQTLALWRSTGRYGLRYFKVGKKAVRYSVTDLERFVASRAVEPAAAAG